MSKQLVVTGGAGFIGSCLIRHLNEMGIEEIVVVDDLGQDDRWKNLVGKRFADILHKNDFFAWLERNQGQVEGIIHLGACSSTVETDANYLLENNYRYSVRLASWALREGCRFIYASSAATYGDGALGFSDDHDGLEDLRPLNMYGYSKHLFDLWLKREKVLDRVVGLKYFNVFGPNEFHKGRMASALLKMVPEVRSQGAVRLFRSSEPEKFADGQQVRDFIYVKDAVRMTASFLANDLTGIYNIGTGTPGTWKALATSLFKGLGIPPRIDFIEMPSDLIGKYQNYTCADMSKAQAAKVPLPHYSLEKATIEYVQQYLVPNAYF